MYCSRLSALQGMMDEVQIQQLEEYFDSLIGGASKNITVSKIVKALGISPQLASRILTKCKEIGIIKASYAIRCPECGMLIQKMDSIADIPSEPFECYSCNEIITADPKNIEIIYSLEDHCVFIEGQREILYVPAGPVAPENTMDNIFKAGNINEYLFHPTDEEYQKLNDMYASIAKWKGATMPETAFALRPYQQECKEIIERNPEGRHLIALATGLGKTVIFTHLDTEGRTLILSHRDELVRQPEKFYEGRRSFGVEKAEEHSNGEEIVSASVQTLSRDGRLEQFSPDDFHTIIVDEAHHTAAKSYRKILDYFSGAKLVLGFTAIPKRGDGVRLTDVFDDILFARDLRWGIQNHYLSHIRCLEVTTDLDLRKVEKTAGDFNSI